MSGRLPLVDYHVHTARCGHAVGSIERYVERAIEAGLSELGFSDHLFMYWLPADARDPELGMAEWEHAFYIEDVERCRERYKTDISIRLSIEADYIPGHEQQLETILRRSDFDYVIGSVHFIDGWGFDDERYLAGYADWDIDALYTHYFDLVGASADTGLFDTIGHADLIKKFGHRARAGQAQAYAALAQRFARAGVCVEVNTAGLRRPCDEVYPHLDMLRACREAGVSATLASDAHAPGDVARDLGAAVDALQRAGYTSFVRYEQRKRKNQPLPEGEAARSAGEGASAGDAPSP